jgi:hypothetical protein
MIPYPCPNEVYESALTAALVEARRNGIRGVAFGDLFLADIRRYREGHLEGTGLSLYFPLGPRLTPSRVMLRSWRGTRPGRLCEQRPGAPS